MSTGGKLAAIALAATFAIASYYTINGQPAPPNIALVMMANGLPAGNYWLDQRTGNWGMVGLSAPLGNIYAAQGSVSGGGGAWSECSANGCVSGNSRTGVGAITDGHGGAAVTDGDGHLVFTPN